MSSQYPFYNFFSDKLFDCLCLQQKNLKNHHLSCMFLIDCLIWSLWEGPHLFVKIFQVFIENNPFSGLNYFPNISISMFIMYNAIPGGRNLLGTN